MNSPTGTPLAYCISEGRATAENFREIKQDILAKVGNAHARGVGLFQIREKRLSASLLFDLVRGAVWAAGKGVKVLVNGRADVAIAAGAHGVHLPADDVPARELRAVVPDGFTIGISTHSIGEVQLAKAVGADLVTFGPVFASPGKGTGVGVAALSQACSAGYPMPVFALGGMDEGTILSIAGSGAAGYAAIRHLNRRLAG